MLLIDLHDTNTHSPQLAALHSLNPNERERACDTASDTGNGNERDKNERNMLKYSQHKHRYKFAFSSTNLYCLTGKPMHQRLQSIGKRETKWTKKKNWQKDGKAITRTIKWNKRFRFYSISFYLFHIQLIWSCNCVFHSIQWATNEWASEREIVRFRSAIPISTFIDSLLASHVLFVLLFTLVSLGSKW